jgi:sugar lactone lactonase YvrE
VTKARAVEVAVALETGASLGEGPVWDSDTGRLLWVDIFANAVHSFDPDTHQDATFDVGGPVGAVALRAAGGWVLALEDGFGVTEPGRATVDLIAPVDDDDRSIRFNDGCCDPAGRFWAGTVAYNETPGAGSLYRLDQDHRVERMLTGITISNGLAWSTDGRTMYYIDTPTGGVDAFDFDTESGSIGNRRRVVDVPGPGMPDGMAIDTDGCLWVALWGGWAVHRYRPDGRLDTIVEVPAGQITSCAFGGPELEDLFITSAREGLGVAELTGQPHAGALFQCRPGARGVPAVAFAG